MNEKRQTISDDVTLAGPGAGRRAELAPGARLGRYEIVRLLGRGGMGQVYLARHGLQKTLHALKILPAEFSGRPGFVDRFRTELQTMARLQHPNIVHVTHSDEENGRYYLVMDFVAADGTGEPYDLEEALAVEGRLAPETVRRLMLGLCDGLCHAHGHGVVHRDLKPANVLLTSKDLSAADARICDFGLARVVGEEQVRTLVAQSMQRSLSLGEKSTFVEKRREERSSTGSVLGTYGYMSPEQEEGKPADGRSDLYALGVMMYRMITGQRLRGMAKPASQVVEGLDPAWDAVIGRCLENDPEARWQAAGELKAALRRIGEGSQKSGVRSQKKRALGLAAALLVLGYGIYRAYGTYSDRRAEERAQAERAAALEEVTHPTAGNVLGMLFVEVEPGSFRMGSEDGWFDEKPARAVRLTRLFWMGKHEVTQREYQQLTGSNPSHFKGDNLPVETVSWDDAVKFCEELTRRERAAGRMPAGYEYRLPTEAEWEYAARGGAKSRGYAYAGGNDLDAVAWYGDNSGSATHPVGQKEANELGLFDMSGNVWEWCQDWYQGSYTGLGTDDPSGPSSGSNRVGRGGGWGVDTSYCRIASRGNGTPSFTGYNLGLRVCLAPPVQ